MVSRISHNPLLKGVRVRNKKMSRRTNKTGKHHSVDAPESERLERVCPHLAFFEADYYDRVMLKTDAANQCYRRKGAKGLDHRKAVSKKRTTWPGQHLRCGICNRIYHWSGVRKRRCMKCSGSHVWNCWNAVEVNGVMLTRKLADATLAKIMALPEFDDVFLEKVKAQWKSCAVTLIARNREIERRLVEISREIIHVTDAVSKMGLSQSLEEKLLSLEADQRQLLWEMDENERTRQRDPALPPLETLKQKASELFLKFAPDDPEIGRLMRALIPSLKVYPYKICDGGSVVLRAQATICLTALTREPLTPMAHSIFERFVAIDLFESPERVRYREEIMKLRGQKMTQRQIAVKLGITQTAVQKAAALSRLMTKLGLTDPYVALQEPTNSCGLRRHLHPRYEFKPLSD